MVRKEFTDLKDSTLVDFETYTGRKVGSDKNVKFANGSTLMFRHGGEINVLKNINLTAFGIEQAEEFETEETFTYLRDRLRRNNVTFHQGLIIANTNGHNWIWKLWKLSDDPDYHLVEATTFDNEDNLPADFIADLKKMETQAPHHYNRYVMNSWEDVDTTDNVIQYAWIREAVNRKLSMTALKRIISVDVAREGDNETVIYAMNEKEILGSQIYTKKSTMETAGRICQMKDKYKANLIAIDAVGVGGGVVDRLKELLHHDIASGRVEILQVIGGAKATNDKYKNLKSQIWFEAAEEFSEQIVSIPDDEILIEQLYIPRYKVFSDKQIQVESKEDVKKRLKTPSASPDRSDCYVQGRYALKKAKPITRSVKYDFKIPEPPQNAGIKW
jgi:hypothetical protein